jgi:O-acetylserine/cysteine efflux transporter
VTPRDAALATLVAVIWGANFVAIDRGLEGFPPLLFVAVRFLFVCLPAVLFVPRPTTRWRDIALIGLFMSAGQFGLVYLAMHLGMPAGLTPLVLQSQVLFTLLFASVALREHPTRGQLAGVLVGAAGLVTVGVGRAAHAPVVPVLLVVAAASAWAVGNVIARRVGARGQSGSGLSMVVWSGTVVPLPMIALSWAVEGRGAIVAAVSHPDLGAVGSAVFTAYLASLLGYGLWNGLLARYPASSVVPFTMLVPVVGMATASWALDEVPTRLELIGGVVLLAGVAAAALLARRRPARAGSRLALGSGRPVRRVLGPRRVVWPQRAPAPRPRRVCGEDADDGAGVVDPAGEHGLLGLVEVDPADRHTELLPVLHGAYSESTVWDGIRILMDHHEWAVAIIVFLASMVIPLVKLAGLFSLVVTSRMGWGRRLRGRTHLYKFIDAIGPWAMLDVFLLAVLVALVKLQGWAEILPGTGLFAFTAMVVLTMLASAAFDPKLIWQRP